jgi:hypothetical protein
VLTIVITKNEVKSKIEREKSVCGGTGALIVVVIVVVIDLAGAF